MLKSSEYEIFFCSTSVGILTFMNRKNRILDLSEPKKAEFLDIFIIMSILNHEKCFISSGPGVEITLCRPSKIFVMKCYVRI